MPTSSKTLDPPKKPARKRSDPLLADCRLTFFKASGPGGQHRNKTSTAVRLKHLPTGIIVTAADSRSQYRNRLNALERLRARLRARSRKPKPRKKTGVPRSVRARNLNAKKRHAQKKSLRRKPTAEE